MMTFEELNAALEIRRAIEMETSRLEDLKLCAVSVGGSQLDGMPKAKPQSSKTEKLTVKIMESEERLQQLQAELAEASGLLAERLSNELNGSSLMLSVMLRRYVAGLSCTAIARQLNFTLGYVQKVHLRGVLRLTGNRPPESPKPHQRRRSC